MSIRVTFSIFISILIFAILSIFTTVILVTRVREIQSSLITADTYIADRTTQELTAGFADYYYYQYDTYLSLVKDFIKRYPDIIQFKIYSPEGEIMFSTDELDTKQKQTGKKVDEKKLLDIITTQKTVQEFGTTKGERTIVIYAPYFDKFDIYRNMVEYHFSLEKINNAIYQSVLILIIGLVISTTISIGGTLLLVNQILKPVVELTKAADYIAKGNYNMQVKVKDENNELGILAKTFNSMVQEVEKSKHTLEEYNTKLQAEVAEKTKELKDKVDNLERMQKLTMDRETRMIQLKEENIALKARCGMKDGAENLYGAPQDSTGSVIIDQPQTQPEINLPITASAEKAAAVTIPDASTVIPPTPTPQATTPSVPETPKV